MRNVVIKKNGLGFAYVFVILLGIGVCLLAIEEKVLLIFGIFFVVIGLGTLIDYLSFPKFMISINEKSQVVIHRKNIILRTSEINRVSSMRAKLRFHYYKFLNLNNQFNKRRIYL